MKAKKSLKQKYLVVMLVLSLFLTVIILFYCSAPLEEVDLAAGFQNPPASAKPHNWWHWMNGNISKEGITKDLEAMARVGIGGFQIFQVGR